MKYNLGLILNNFRMLSIVIRNNKKVTKGKPVLSVEMHLVKSKSHHIQSCISDHYMTATPQRQSQMNLLSLLN